MQINFQTLKSLPVETENGTALGQVFDIEIDPKNHIVKKYLVSSKLLFKENNELIIAPDQIVEINNKKIIVLDSIIKEQVTEAKPTTVVAGSPASVNMSSKEA